MSMVQKKFNRDRETRIKSAMKAMKKNKELVYTEAVRLFGVRRSTLHDHMSKKCTKFTKGRDPLLTQTEETHLVKILVGLQSKGYVITPNTCRIAAYLYAELCNYHQNLNKNVKMAGRKWFSAFVKRNNVHIMRYIRPRSHLAVMKGLHRSNEVTTRLENKS